MKKKVVRLLISAAVIAALVVLDQWTKSLAVQYLKPIYPDSMVLWKGVFELEYLENHGMAFGLLQNAQWFFYVVTGIFLLVGGFLLWKTPEEKRFLPMHVLLSLVLAGAVGNLIDRIVHQYVVDFFYFSLIDFPVFNVADCFVTVGIALIAVFILFYYKDEDLKRAYGFRKEGKPEGE